MLTQIQVKLETLVAINIALATVKLQFSGNFLITVKIDIAELLFPF